jgi:hypothetical protein
VWCVTGGFVDGSGRYCIASTALDRTLRVWDVSTGTAVSVVWNEEMGVTGAVESSRLSVVTGTGDTGKCRLAIAASGGRLIFVEQLSLVRAVAMP